MKHKEMRQLAEPQPGDSEPLLRSRADLKNELSGAAFIFGMKMGSLAIGAGAILADTLTHNDGLTAPGLALAGVSLLFDRTGIRVDRTNLQIAEITQAKVIAQDHAIKEAPLDRSAS